MDNMSGGKSALGLDANVAGLLANIPICLIGLVISIIILVTDKTNKLARFYAFQSLLLHGLLIASYIVGVVVIMVGASADIAILAMLGALIYILGFFGVIILFIISCIMAFQGKIFKIPVIGGMADSWSN